MSSTTSIHRFVLFILVSLLAFSFLVFFMIVRYQSRGDLPSTVEAIEATNEAVFERNLQVTATIAAMETKKVNEPMATPATPRHQVKIVSFTSDTKAAVETELARLLDVGWQITAAGGSADNGYVILTKQEDG